MREMKHPTMVVDCPMCGATVGHWCKRPSGHSGPMVAFHAARRKAAEAVLVEIILTPEHPRWREFIDRLAGPEGCDFRKDERSEYSWRCAGGHDQSLSRAILADMGGINVEGTLAYCTSQGGHCDCEVVFNVDRDDAHE